MASQYLSRLGIVLGVDSGELVREVEKARQQFNKFARQVSSDSNAAAKDIIALRDATNDYGKTLTKVEQVEREIQRGRYMYATKTLQDQLRAEAKAYDEKAKAMKSISGVMTEQQKLALTYQTTDLVTQLASGQNPFIALLQQGGQLKDQMGGLGNMFRMLGTFITPVNVGLAATAAAITAVSYALYEADKEFDKFQDSLTLTGNFAGISANKLIDMSKALADMSNTTIGNAVGALDSVVSSGKFTALSIESVTKAILTYSKIAGVDSKTAADKLMAGLDGSAKGAKALNDQMNFLTFAQYKQIEALEQAGQKQEAAKLAADILNQKLEAQKRVLGDIEQAWDMTKNALSRYWSSLKEAVLGPSTNEGLLKKTKEDIEAVEFALSKGISSKEKQTYQDRLAYLKQRRDMLEETIQKAKESEVGSEEKPLISDYDAAGGIGKEKQLALAYAKARAEARYQTAIASANEIQKIELAAAKEIADKKSEYENQSEETKRAFGAQLERNLQAEIVVINAKAQEKIRELRTKNSQAEFEQENAFREEANNARIAEENKIYEARKSLGLKYFEEERNFAFESNKIKMQMSMIGASPKELQIAESRLQMEREIRNLKERTDLDEYDKQNFEGRIRRNQELREANYALAESLQRIQGVYDAVWSNMSSAIENFVRTGKFSIKDFTRSVIQDFLIMQMKLQAMTLVRGLIGSLFPTQGIGILPGDSPLSATGADIMGRRAAGGPVSAGSPYLVGEMGPEIFMPSGSGTIIPNDKLSMADSSPSVVYNGPYIANMSAIDTQSALQFLAKNKQAVWSANQSAQRALPMSR